jgi:hypothetical protein
MRLNSSNLDFTRNDIFTFKANDDKTDSSNTSNLNMSKWYSLTVSKAELFDHNDKVVI